MKKTWLKRGTKQLKMSPLKRIGRQGKINLCANRKIAQMWKEFGVNTCELKLPECLGKLFNQNVHRHKRDWYYRRPELLYARKEVARGCQNCHDLVENNETLREEVFNKIRHGEQ